MGKRQSEPIEALQAVLRGEYMAIGVYDAVVESVESPELKRRLQTVRDNHQRHARQLAQQIRELGGTPPDEAYMRRWTANARIRMRGWYRYDPRSMLHQVYHGEDQSIAATLRVTSNRLDPRSQALIERITAEDRRHLGMLEQVISEPTGHVR